MGVCAHIFLQILLSQCDSHSVILKISAQGCGSLSFKSVAVTSSMFSNPYYFQFAVFTAACHSQMCGSHAAQSQSSHRTLNMCRLLENSSKRLRQMFPTRGLTIQPWLLHGESGPWPIDIHIISINHKMTVQASCSVCAHIIQWPCCWTWSVCLHVDEKKNPLKI